MIIAAFVHAAPINPIVNPSRRGYTAMPCGEAGSAPVRKKDVSFRISGPQKMVSLQGRRRPRECGVELSLGRACGHTWPRRSEGLLWQGCRGTGVAGI